MTSYVGHWAKPVRRRKRKKKFASIFKKTEAQDRGCSPKDHVECSLSGNKISICHQNGNNAHETLCLKKIEAKRIIARNANDYCGVCLEELFVRNSVIQDLVPIAGNEQVVATGGMAYQTTYDVAFRQAGVVSLASSKDLVKTVACLSTGSVQVKFERAPSPSWLSDMFPVDALLVIDGHLFGDCSLRQEDNDNKEEGSVEDGFLVIEAVEVRARIVSVKGTPVSFNYLFEHKALSYQRSGNLRSRKAIEVNESWSKVFPYEDSPFKISTTCSVDAHVTVETLRDEFALFSGWKFDPHFDYALEFSWGIEVGTEFQLAIEASEKLWQYEKTFPWISASIYAVPIPTALRKVIEDWLPASIPLKAELGVYLDIPFALDAGLQFDASMQATAKATLGTGEKAAVFSIDDDLEPELTLTKDEVSNPSGLDFSLPKPSLETTSSLSLNGFVGVVPAVALKILGAGEAKIGFKGGIQTESSKLQFDPPLVPVNEPGLPLEFFCDDCHAMELDLGITARDPFFSGRIGFLAKEDSKYPIGDFESTLDLAKVCLIDHPTSKSCGNLCCSEEETCVTDDTQSPPTNKCVAESPCDKNLPEVDCCVDVDCGDPAFFTCTASYQCEDLPCSTDHPEIQCCDDEHCGDTDKFKCDMRQCALVNCDTSDPDIDCCDVGDCGDDPEVFSCTSNKCVAKGNPRFTLTWFGDGKSFRLCAVANRALFCTDITFACIFRR